MPNPTSALGPTKRGTSTGFMAGGKKPVAKIVKPKLGKVKTPTVGTNAALQANWKV
jgi:hypothetical protein